MKVQVKEVSNRTLFEQAGISIASGLELTEAQKLALEMCAPDSLLLEELNKELKHLPGKFIDLKVSYNINHNVVYNIIYSIEQCTEKHSERRKDQS